MDGAWRHDSSWYERHLHTDVSLTSPFDAVRKTNWIFEHHATQGKYEQKVRTGVGHKASLSGLVS